MGLFGGLSDVFGFDAPGLEEDPRVNQLFNEIFNRLQARGQNVLRREDLPTFQSVFADLEPIRKRRQQQRILQLGQQQEGRRREARSQLAASGRTGGPLEVELERILGRQEALERRQAVLEPEFEEARLAFAALPALQQNVIATFTANEQTRQFTLNAFQDLFRTVVSREAGLNQLLQQASATEIDAFASILGSSGSVLQGIAAIAAL